LLAFRHSSGSRHAGCRPAPASLTGPQFHFAPAPAALATPSILSVRRAVSGFTYGIGPCAPCGAVHLAGLRAPGCGGIHAGLCYVQSRTPCSPDVLHLHGQHAVITPCPFPPLQPHNLGRPVALAVASLFLCVCVLSSLPGKSGGSKLLCWLMLQLFTLV
jgi:hypothetical protein